MINISNNRTILLEKMPGKTVIDNTGAKDYRDFQTSTPLRAIRNDDTNLWAMRYDPPAVIPEILRQQFTTFDGLLKHVTTYFNKRNIRIKEIVHENAI